MNWKFQSVYVARHAETAWNLTGRRQGQLDSPLTATGIGQADAMTRVVAQMAVDGIFASPLGRAQSTATVIGASAGLAVQTIEELTEVHHGEFAGLTMAEIEARYSGALDERAAKKYSWRFPGGESYQDADARAGRALERVQRSGSQRPLLVTHEMTGLMRLRQLLDLTPDEALRRAIPHGVVLDVRPSEVVVRERICE